MVMVVLLMVVIMAFAAFAIDLSRMFAYKSELERAADAAAHAGAIELTKAAYNTADVVAATFANSNPVEGQGPTVDTVQYGTWNPPNGPFTSLCTAPCSATTSAGANAIRVRLSQGQSTPIFAQFVGQFGFTMIASAVAWVAPTVPEHDCNKPFAVKYDSLVQMLNTAEGRTGLNRDLDSTDLSWIRNDGATMTMCLIVTAGDNCGAPAPTYNGLYQPVQLYPPATEGADPYLTEIEEPCDTASGYIGPTDALDTNTVVKAGDTQTGDDGWCALYNPNPCLMKLPVWDTLAVGSPTASDGNVCAANSCLRVRAIVSFIVTGVNEATPSGNPAIAVYPTISVDGDSVGTNPAGTIQRVVLVQ